MSHLVFATHMVSQFGTDRSQCPIWKLGFDLNNIENVRLMRWPFAAEETGVFD